MARGDDPELSYTCAGINHMAFFLRFESAGRDLYPLLRKAMDLPHLWRCDPVRFDLFRRLGFFMTETSGHTAEYTPYFLKHETEIKRCHLRVLGYLETCRKQDAAYRSMRREVKAGKAMAVLPYKPSHEYASRIINGLVTGKPYVFNGNVHNRGGALISNLPGDCCVEVPCTVDRQGVRPSAVGELPPACAALIRTNVNVQDLTVRGILEGSRTYIRQALMLDPLTSGSLSLNRIDQLADALFKAHAKRLPANLR
jgi:alpha-galactosidase